MVHLASLTLEGINLLRNYFHWERCSHHHTQHACFSKKIPFSCLWDCIFSGSVTAVGGSSSSCPGIILTCSSRLFRCWHSKFSAPTELNRMSDKNSPIEFKHFIWLWSLIIFNIMLPRRSSRAANFLCLAHFRSKDMVSSSQTLPVFSLWVHQSSGTFIKTH